MEGSSEYIHHNQQQYSPISDNEAQVQVHRTQDLANAMYANPENVEYFVQMEVNHIKQNYSIKEHQYVEQMLAENPITIERLNNQEQQPNSDDEVDVVTCTSSAQEIRNKLLQYQQAEACRSRNIKKAKAKYRHQFMLQKLFNSANIFHKITEVIAQAEESLIRRGIDRENIQHLRDIYGIDEATTTILQMRPPTQLEL